MPKYVCTHKLCANDLHADTIQTAIISYDSREAYQQHGSQIEQMCAPSFFSLGIVYCSN